MMSKSPVSEIDELLAEGAASAAARERTEFDRCRAASPDGFILFGAGNMGRTTARRLRSVGVQPIAFTDTNARLWGSSIDGIPVLAPADAAAKYGSTAMFVITIWGVSSRERMAARRLQLQDLGCTNVIPFVWLFWKYPELFLPYHVIDRPSKVLDDASAVRSTFDLWSDDFSRREYVAQLKWRMFGEFDSMADPVPQTIYFPDDLFALTEREVFIDCGGYDGDTVRAFLKVSASRFERIVAFEPDPISYDKLVASVAALPREIAGRIETHRKATGAANGTVRFAALGTRESAIGVGDSEVECVTLDRALSDAVPTHVKMDIEGAEMEALEGARNTIARHSPVLAICTYHLQNDLWRIPALIHSINPEYKFYLRPHLLEGWDVVCYAIPPQRTNR